MKKLFLFIFLSLTCFSAATLRAEEPARRGLFVSVIQNPTVFSSREEISKLIQFSKKSGTRLLFVQIYRSNMAWFPSEVGDDTPYRECLKTVGEDPFKLLINEAHAAGIEVHAWLNMLTLSQNEKAYLLRKHGPDILTRNQAPKRSISDYKIDNQYFLEPGDLTVRAELVKMVGEIVNRYPELDGLQFDYIRYPDSHPEYGYTPQNLKRFHEKTGVDLKDVNEKNQLWRQWKRDQVTELLDALIQKAKSVRPRIQVSTTGCMNLLRALEEAFQDWPLWLSSERIHFVTVMSYPADLPSFQKNIAEAKLKTQERFNQVYIGVGAYKQLKTPQVFKEQFEDCEKSVERGCVVFHYGSILENPKLAETLAA